MHQIKTIQTASPTAAPASATLEQSLYEVHRKIYPRAVRGWFARWRLLLVLATQLAFYGTAWLTWNQRQAVLFDLVHRKFYIFGLVFWPQDFIYLTALLVISAFGLFLFTAVAGRLWCGYACPQTVYTEIFLWIERKIEGDRAARMRLDDARLGWRKLYLKTLKHGAWIALALWTGLTFVGYFTPIRELTTEVMQLDTGPWETFWILFYGVATYGNAGWMREQVCKYMCPYARFQSAMFDQDTMIITYDHARGEPRGARKHGEYAGLGQCVDCGICVQVCPTGIDIRNGLQYECIGCAACADGCDQVMDKMGYPRGLIRYSTTHALRLGLSRAQMFARALRPRILFYIAILGLVVMATTTALLQRVPLKLDVIRDRAAMSRELDGGLIENVYRLQVMNTRESPRRYVLRVEGLPQLVLAGDDHVAMQGASTRMVTVRARVPMEQVKAGSHKIHFIMTDEDDPQVSVTERSVFFIRP